MIGFRDGVNFKYVYRKKSIYGFDEFFVVCNLIGCIDLYCVWGVFMFFRDCLNLVFIEVIRELSF